MGGGEEDRTSELERTQALSPLRLLRCELLAQKQCPVLTMSTGIGLPTAVSASRRPHVCRVSAHQGERPEAKATGRVLWAPTRIPSCFLSWEALVGSAAASAWNAPPQPREGWLLGGVGGLPPQRGFQMIPPKVQLPTPVKLCSVSAACASPSRHSAGSGIDSLALSACFPSQTVITVSVWAARFQ